MAEREQEKVTLELTCSNCFKKQQQCSCEAPSLVEQPDKSWWPKGYSLTDKLGENPRAVLYKGKLGGSEQSFAIKVMKASCAENRDFQRKVRQEVKALTQLTHPNIGAIYDGGLTDDSRPYIVRDYVDGMPLSAVLDKEGSLDPQEFFEVFEQVCEAVAAAHQCSVSHFGLSPENILLIGTPAGSRTAHHVKVVDFASTNLAIGDGDSAVTGDPRYLSPEQIQGAPKEISSDVYALGCVMYEALCGRPPFSNAPPESLKRSHIQEAPEPINKACKTKISPALSDLVSRCLSKYPHNRFDSFNEILEELKRVETLPAEAAESNVPPNKNMADGRFASKITSEVASSDSSLRTRDFVKLDGSKPEIRAERLVERPADRIADRSADRTTDRPAAGVRAADYPKPSWLPEFTPKTAMIGVTALLVVAFASVFAVSSMKPAVPQKPAWVVMVDEANSQQRLGNLANAEMSLNNALTAAEEGKASQEDVAGILAKLGSLFYLQNRPNEAAPFLMRALPLYETIQGAAGKDVMWIANDIAEIAVKTNNWTLANEMYHKLLAGVATDGSDAAQRLKARYLGSIGAAYIHEHNYQQALKSLNECYAIQKKLKGGLTAGVSKTTMNIAYAYDKLSQLKDAEKFYKESVDVLKSVKPLDKAGLAKAYDYLGNFLKRTGKSAQGDAALNEARKLRGLPPVNGDGSE